MVVWWSDKDLTLSPQYFLLLFSDPTPRSLADVGRRWPACSRKAPFVHLRFRDDGSAEVQEYPSKLADALKFWQKMRTDYSFDLVLGIDKHTLRSRDEL